MKALEKDRDRRYQTVRGLWLDIERYLTNEPIDARPPSSIYRLQKMARRTGCFLPPLALPPLR
jgi:hypothetical protein